MDIFVDLELEIALGHRHGENVDFPGLSTTAIYGIIPSGRRVIWAYGILA